MTFGTEGERRDPIYSLMSHALKVPSTVEIPNSLSKQVTGEDKLDAMLSGVAPSTRKRYLSAWNQWAYFMRNRSTWLVKTKPNLDGEIIDFVTFESHVAKNASDATRGKISAV